MARPLLPDGFKARVELRDAQRILTLVGELDIASGPVLEAILASLCVGGAKAIAIDLSELTSIDSFGVTALVAGQRLCDRDGCEFSLRPGSESVQRALESSGRIVIHSFRLATPRFVQADPADRMSYDSSTFDGSP